MIDPLDVLRFLKPPQIALVGAGGKTTWMFALGRAFLSQHTTVLLTTTTHLATWQTQFADFHLVVTTQHDLPVQADDLPTGLVLLTGSEITDNRIVGLEADALASIQKMARAAGYPLFIEADGSRQRPLKAPAEYEPAIPDSMDGVIVLAGLHGLNKPLDEACVHRPQLFSALSDIAFGKTVTEVGLAKVLVDPNGGLKGISSESRRFALLTQANDPQMLSQAGSLAKRLLPAYDTVLIGETSGISSIDFTEDPANILKREIETAQVIAAYKPIAGVILAAGGSSRFDGRLKQLLDWNGVPLVRHVAQKAIEAGLSPVLVITGAESSAVKGELTGLPVEIEHNSAWELGQSTSIQTAIQAFPQQVGAAMFILVDQPQIPVTLIRALMDMHRSTLAPVIAPLIDGDRGNPVIFDQRTFADLEELEGDVGGRAVFSRFRVTWVPWHDGRMRLDIDTESDYLKLAEEMGIKPSVGEDLCTRTKGKCRMAVFRAFIPIEISDEMQIRLDQVISHLIENLQDVQVRWVPAKNIHLTLKFLGDVSDANYEILTKILAAEAATHRNFEFSIGGLGAYPNNRRPRVIWVGVQAPNEMHMLQRGIDTETARLGYASEKRKFTPHLTLGRVSRNASARDIRSISQLLDKSEVGFLGVTRVDEICLYRSDLKPGGAVYKRLFTAKLGGRV